MLDDRLDETVKKTETGPPPSAPGSITDPGTSVLTKRKGVAVMTRHRAVMVMLLKGLAVKEIAREMGYAPQSISILIRTKAFQLELDKLKAVVLANVEDDLTRLGHLTPMAHGFYNKVLADPGNVYSADLKFKVSKDLFDRLGVQEKDPQGKRTTHLGDVAELVSSAFEKAQVIEVVDAEVVGDEAEIEISGEQITAELKELLESANEEEDSSEVNPAEEDEVQQEIANT